MNVTVCCCVLLLSSSHEQEAANSQTSFAGHIDVGGRFGSEILLPISAPRSVLSHQDLGMCKYCQSFLLHFVNLSHDSGKINEALGSHMVGADGRNHLNPGDIQQSAR